MKGLFGNVPVAMKSADGTWIAVIGWGPKSLRDVAARVMRYTRGKCNINKVRDEKDCVESQCKRHCTVILLLSVSLI
jgi:hypothetical protein